jgi:hypothetical protein
MLSRLATTGRVTYMGSAIRSLSTEPALIPIHPKIDSPPTNKWIKVSWSAGVNDYVSDYRVANYDDLADAVRLKLGQEVMINDSQLIYTRIGLVPRYWMVNVDRDSVMKQPTSFGGNNDTKNNNDNDAANDNSSSEEASIAPFSTPIEIKEIWATIKRPIVINQSYKLFFNEIKTDLAEKDVLSSRSLNLTPATLGITGLPNGVNEGDIRYFFRGFRLSKGDGSGLPVIRPYPSFSDSSTPTPYSIFGGGHNGHKSREGGACLVTFQNEGVAREALRYYQHAFVNDKRVKVEHFCV